MYNKLSSNNNNNYHHVSVIQVCVSELTTCRILVLYNTYIAAFTLADTDVNSVLEIGQQQLALYAHFSQTMVILTLLSDNILFVQICITSQQMRTYVDFWQLYWLSEMQYDTFFEMLSYIKTFQWVLQQLQVMWSCCSLLHMQQWYTHCYLKWWEQQQHQWGWAHC